jgi:hypothetical protein
MKARCILTNMTDLVKSGRARDRIPHAPFTASEIAVNEAPKVQAFKTPPKDRQPCRGATVLRSQ